MIKALILAAVEYPYMVVRLVDCLFHVTVLPGDLDHADLWGITKAQAAANRLDTCLLLSEHEVLWFDQAGAERVSDAVPFPMFAHWSSAAITGRLKTAVPLPSTLELERRKAILQAATTEYPRQRAELLKRRGMVPPGDYLVGDLTKGGRDATPAELEALSGRQSSGVPMGLAQCSDCGAWKGECLDPSPEFSGKVMRVCCRCENANRCAACGETLYRFRLNANLYDVRAGAVVHVPGFSGLSHQCAVPEGVPHDTRRY